MPGEINCVFTKSLLPFVEREIGPGGMAALLRTAGHSREYLMTEDNWIPLSLADELVRVCMELIDENDEDRWARHFAEDFIGRRPSPEEEVNLPVQRGWGMVRWVSVGRRRADFRFTPYPGVRISRWLCTWSRVCYELYPTHWGLPRARIAERQCIARGDEACLWEVRWKSPSVGVHFWAPTAAGIAASGSFGFALGAATALPWLATVGLASLPVLCGGALGYALLRRRRRRLLQKLLEVPDDEIV
jgi:hypothetical protein